MNVYYVYVLWNKKHAKPYTGQTDDLEKRLAQHNDPEQTLTRYTKRYDGGWELIHQEKYATRREAIIRERELKTGNGRAWLKANVYP